MYDEPDNTLVAAKSSSSLTTDQFLMHELMRQGPSFIMIGLACGMDHKEVERTFKASPTLKSAYRGVVADIALKVREYNGNKSLIAEDMNVGRHIVEQWIRENRMLQVELNNAEEGIVDLAEAALITAVKKGNDWAVLHVLNTKGKNRGWARRDTIDLNAYAQATSTDVRSIVGDVVGALAAGLIDVDVDIVED